MGPNGQVDQLKARLVAKGYNQIFGLEGDTLSPVAQMTSIRLIIGSHALFASTLVGHDLIEDVYIEQPSGFVAQRESRGSVCRLHKALYGLKQSP